MIDPIAIGEIKEYILKSEREQRDENDKIIKEANPNPTVWMLGALDSMEMNKLDSMGMSVTEVDGKVEVKRNHDEIFKKDFTIVKHGLKGFKNFGKTVFETDKVRFFDHEKDIVKDSVIAVIHPDIIFELSQEIWSSNRVSGELEKN